MLSSILWDTHPWLKLELVFVSGKFSLHFFADHNTDHRRIYSRAFIIGSLTNPNDRFVYLVLDTACGDTAIRYGVLAALAKLGPSHAMYNQSNVALTGIHSHSGPGAWLNYLLKSPVLVSTSNRIKLL